MLSSQCSTSLLSALKHFKLASQLAWRLPARSAWHNGEFDDTADCQTHHLLMSKTWANHQLFHNWNGRPTELWLTFDWMHEDDTSLWPARLIPQTNGETLEWRQYARRAFFYFLNSPVISSEWATAGGVSELKEHNFVATSVELLITLVSNPASNFDFL